MRSIEILLCEFEFCFIFLKISFDWLSIGYHGREKYIELHRAKDSAK